MYRVQECLYTMSWLVCPFIYALSRSLRAVDQMNIPNPRSVVRFKLFFTEPLKFRILPREKQVEISEMVAVKRFANERR